MRLFLTALLVLAAACGSDDTTEAAGTTATTASTTTTTTGATAPEPSCSTAGLRIELVAQDDLPPVADMRRQIFEAAVACDFEELGALANAGDSSFTASFGGGEVPEVWQTKNDPLRTLVLVLNMSSATTDDGVSVWPAAFARPSWDEVPPAERDELAPVYDAEAQEDFASFGAYIGHRVGITADGDWIFFVAGD